MTEVEIKLPEHAIRFLKEMCERERVALIDLSTSTFGRNMQLMAAFDSLDAIESALSND